MGNFLHWAPVTLFADGEVHHQGLWPTDIEWWQFPIRAVVVYIFLLMLLRLTGKRQVGQLSPFDLVLLLVLSNAVQNSMNGGDNSITGGLILAVSLVALNYLVSYLTFRSKRLEALIEGRPVILIHNGKVDHAAMQQVQMTLHELEASLRNSGCAGPHEVRFAVLENNGSVSVIPRDKK
ncbi:MAG TPA: YetF domain-containing protein [Pirellulales bacterium]|nr:YetF domain-containing protein [Pirellulales bacterium]